MINKKLSRKAHHFGIQIGIVILLITSISLGFYTSNTPVTGAVVGMESISGEMVKVTGMAVEDQLKHLKKYKIVNDALKSNKVNDAFLRRMIGVSNKVGAQPISLFGYIRHETSNSFSPAKTNSIGATGLIQFVPSTAQKLLKTSTKAEATTKLKGMTQVKQLDVVEQYLLQYSNYDLSNDLNLGTAIFYPKCLGKSSCTITPQEGAAFTNNVPLQTGNVIRMQTFQTTALRGTKRFAGTSEIASAPPEPALTLDERIAAVRKLIEDSPPVTAEDLEQTETTNLKIQLLKALQDQKKYEDAVKRSLAPGKRLDTKSQSLAALKKKEAAKLTAKIELLDVGTISYIAQTYKDTSPENKLRREAAQEILKDRVKTAASTNNREELLEIVQAGGENLVFASYSDKNVKDFINSDPILQYRYQTYVQIQKVCRGCIPNEDGTLIDASGNKFQIIVKADGSQTMVKISGKAGETGEAAVTSALAAKKQDLINRVIDEISYDPANTGLLDVVEGDDLLVARMVDGTFRKIIVNPLTGTHSIGEKIDITTFKVDNKKFTKFKGYTIGQNTPVYKDSKGRIFVTSDLNNPLKKDQQLTLTEVVKDKDSDVSITLQKVLLMGSNGKPTSDVAKNLILVGGKPIEIDSETHKTIKATKGKGIEEPIFETYDSYVDPSDGHVDETGTSEDEDVPDPQERIPLTQKERSLTIKIGDTTRSFVGFDENGNLRDTHLKRIVIEEDVYKDKNGKTYTKREYDNIDKEEREELKITKGDKKLTASDRAWVFENKKVKTTLTSSYKFLGNMPVVETQARTGGTVDYYYSEKASGEEIEMRFTSSGRPDIKAMTDMYGADIIIQKYPNVNRLTESSKFTCLTEPNCPPASVERGNKFQNQLFSRFFFAQMESILTEFSGLGYYATLFFEDEDLDAWREGVDEVFSTLYLGTEYWTSDICSVYTDIDRSNAGVAYVDTKMGLAGVAAHIEASKNPAILPDGTQEILYKITFNVKNGDWEDDPKALEKMEFNIVVKGEKEVEVYKKNKVLEKGDSFGALGSSAIIQYSNSNYDTVCIVFEDTPSSWNIDDELCNTIQGPSAPTSTGSSASGSTEETTGDTNDF